MSVISPPAHNASANGFPPAALYRLSVEQYHDMIRKGILKDGDRVELVEGVLVKKMTINPPHNFATQTLRDLLGPLAAPGFSVSVQGPVTTQDSEPEPDISVVRGDRRHYLEQGRHPGPDDTALIIEVSDSSLHVDETTMLRTYARARIAVYWIVNLVERRIQVYSDPTGPVDPPGYGRRQDFGPTDEVPVVLDGQEVGHVRVGERLV
jgi:Uma2 family endonuclease